MTNYLLRVSALANTGIVDLPFRILKDNPFTRYTITQHTDGFPTPGGIDLILRENGSVTPESIAGYFPVGVRAEGGGYRVIWRNTVDPTAHIYVEWVVDATGNKSTPATDVTANVPVPAETEYGIDLNKDGVLGRAPALAMAGDSYRDFFVSNAALLNDFTWSQPVNVNGSGGASLTAAIADIPSLLSSNPQSVLLFWDGGDSLSAYPDASTAATRLGEINSHAIAANTPWVYIGPVPQKYGSVFEQTPAEVANLAQFRANAAAAYPDNVIDVMPILQKLVSDAFDQEAVDNGFIPPSLFNVAVDDFSHLGPEAHTAIFPTVLAAIKGKWPEVDLTLTALNTAPASVTKAVLPEHMIFSGSDLTGFTTDLFGNSANSTVTGAPQLGPNGGFNMTEATGDTNYVTTIMSEVNTAYPTGAHVAICYRKIVGSDDWGLLVGSTNNFNPDAGSFIGSAQQNGSNSGTVGTLSAVRNWRYKTSVGGTNFSLTDSTADRGDLWNAIYNNNTSVRVVTAEDMRLAQDGGSLRWGRYDPSASFIHAEIEFLGWALCTDASDIDDMNDWLLTWCQV